MIGTKTDTQTQGLSRLGLPGLRRSCESLLANIRFASVDTSMRAICVASAGTSEGKSTTCVNLACAMASSGKRVLLVECDMRRRSLAGMCATHPAKGLYSVLSGGCSVADAVEETSERGVWLLDCEPGIPNPPDILASERFVSLVAALRHAYDYVVVDTPPLGAFVDAALVAQAVDGVVFVVREHGSRRPAVRQALAQLEAAGARVLGLALTFAREEKHSDYYYSYYYKDGERKRTHEHTEKMFAPEPPSPEEAASAIEGDFDAWAAATGLGQYIEHVDGKPQTLGKHSAQAEPEEAPRGRFMRGRT